MTDHDPHQPHDMNMAAEADAEQLHYHLVMQDADGFEFGEQHNFATPWINQHVGVGWWMHWLTQPGAMRGWQDAEAELDPKDRAAYEAYLREDATLSPAEVEAELGEWERDLTLSSFRSEV